MNGPEAGASPATVLMLADFLYTQGQDVEQWLIEAGVDISWLSEKQEWLSTGLVIEIWRSLLMRSGNEMLGHHVGLGMGTMKSNVLALLASNSPTVGEALHNLCKYHGVMAADPQPYLQEVEQGALFYAAINIPDPLVTRHITECMFTIIVSMIRQMSRKQLSPIRVELKHSISPQSAELESFFQCPIMTNADDNIIMFSHDVLGAQVPLADPEFLLSIERHIKNLLNRLSLVETWSAKVERELMTAITEGDISISFIAGRLAMSTRSLQQKLKQEGESFQRILDRVRREIAIDYLSDKYLPIADLALQLGFSEQSAFNHAFKRWTGVTPSHFRSKN